VEDAGREGGAGEDRMDAGEGFGDGALDWGGEGIGEGKGLGADGEEEGAFGQVTVEMLAETQKQRRSAGVGEQGVWFAGQGTDRFAMDEAGGEAGGGVEKDGEVAAAERFGEFRSPLLGGVYRDSWAGKLIAELAGELEGDGVVAANGIATGEDEGASHGRVIRGKCCESRGEKRMKQLGVMTADDLGGCVLVEVLRTSLTDVLRMTTFCCLGRWSKNRQMAFSS